MQVRLAFSLMLQVDADILLVDEVLAVGDAAFQEKCVASLEELQARGTTIVLVTHDMDAIEKHCDRALLLEGGVVESDRRCPQRRRALSGGPLRTRGEAAQVETDPAGRRVTGVWIDEHGGRAGRVTCLRASRSWSTRPCAPTTISRADQRLHGAGQQPRRRHDRRLPRRQPRRAHTARRRRGASTVRVSLEARLAAARQLPLQLRPGTPRSRVASIGPRRAPAPHDRRPSTDESGVVQLGTSRQRRPRRHGEAAVRAARRTPPADAPS